MALEDRHVNSGTLHLAKSKSFQGSYGLTADGIVGSATWKKFASATNPRLEFL
ncbi:peptidoglycan-binding domain-containing protein [Clostridioides difficile]